MAKYNFTSVMRVSFAALFIMGAPLAIGQHVFAQDQIQEQDNVPSLPTDNIPNLPSVENEAGQSGNETVSGSSFGRVAQGGNLIDNGAGILDREYRLHMLLNPDKVKPNEVHSLFFTAWQHALLQEAKQYFKTRPVSEDEIAQLGSDGRPMPQRAARPMGPRELSLGGIAYRGAKDWTIWINSQRVTPTAIPKEILDIQVTQNYIDLKWYDTYTNLIYPVRLRPHQRFNLDSRIFLPGAGVGEPLPPGAM